MVILIVLIAGALLIASSKLEWSLAAYMLFTAATLWLSYDRAADVPHLALFAFLGALKLVAGPLAVVLLARKYRVPSYLAPSFNGAWRVCIAVAAACGAYEIARMPALSSVPQAALVLYAIFASIAAVVLHRNLLAHVVGLLALGSTITLAGAVFAPGLPGSVELADTFDALVATVIAVFVARAIVAYDPNLDIRSLRELRG